MTEEEEQFVVLPAFTFRIALEDVASYRRGLGVMATRVPFGMALRALSSEPVQSALRQAARGCTPIHVAQEFRSRHALRAGFDYVCDIRFRFTAEDRLRIEQRLSHEDFGMCLLATSDLVLVKT